MKFDWKPLLAEPAGQTVARGSLLLLKDDSRRGEEIVAMVAEAFGDNRGHYNMVQLSGNESGINPVRVLSHSAFKPGESFSVGWLIRNWNDWVWPGSDVSSAQICYGPVPAGCFKQEESGEPIRGNAMKFDWKPLLAEPAGQTVARGSLLLLQDNSWRDEEVVIMVCEAFGDGQTNRNLVRLSGSK
ncbi:MAG: immunity 45 family protein, partial [Burkholderiaceae bacterium]|nr:immunity 45 family protein [Burkholderiaceae bacterium]